MTCQFESNAKWRTDHFEKGKKGTQIKIKNKKKILSLFRY